MRNSPGDFVSKSVIFELKRVLMKSGSIERLLLIHRNVVCHTSDNMTKGLWIWKERLTEVLTAISDETDMKLTSSSLDEIKYGLVGTSDEKDNWFDYKIGDVTIRLAVDNDDNSIVHMETSGLGDKTLSRLSNIGTKLP